MELGQRISLTRNEKSMKKSKYGYHKNEQNQDNARQRIIYFKRPADYAGHGILQSFLKTSTHKKCLRLRQ